ncbi:AAA family ATPase [Rouxiella sp. WC2420]|uniref:AAA family ATPase n=1 Tax=Rouxiella sp. WC2420 TaxID=3234145 RepID=A0AB39VXI3_9GAMM
MFVRQLRINGYRSIRNIELELGQLNVICGPNGCGKSNLYKAVKLLHEASQGQLAAVLAEEGGIQKTLWAGKKRSGESRMNLSATLEDFDYELQVGFENSPGPGSSIFTLDPWVKAESLWMTGHQRRPSSRLVDASLGRFQMMMQREGIYRPLEASELSDGTLRFVCLAVAILSPRPPSFMAFNEPENSLHPDLIPALAMLLAETSRYSQLWITSHSPELAELIRQHAVVQCFELAQRQGETQLA